MSKPIRVLVLEDNVNDAELNIRALRRAGFDPQWQRVETEADFLAGLDTSPDLILADHSLPQFDGMQAVKQLRARGLDIPFILLSGTVGEETAVEAIKLGATDYLLKDRIARLGPAVERALEEKRLRGERLAAEAALRQSEQLFHSVWNKSADGMRLTDKDGIIVAVNEAYCQLTGQSAEELTGQAFPVSYVADDPGELLRKYRERFAARAFDAHLERHMTYRSGKTVDLVVSNSLVEVGLPEPLLLGVFHDITERKRAEAALGQSEARFAKAFHSNPAAMCITTIKDGRFLEVNARYSQLFGLTREELLGQTSLKLELWSHPAERALVVGRLQAHGFIRDHATRFRRKNGELVEALISMELIEFPGEREPVLVSMFTDITKRKRAEAKVRLLGAALDAAANEVILTDRNGIIEWVNPAFTKSTGYTLAETVGRNPREILKSGQHDHAFYKNLWDTILRGEVWHAEMVNRKKDKSLFTEEITITPVKDEHGEITHFIAIKQDITERKLLEAQFLRSQRMESLGALAGGIAHDLNNALAPILMSAEILRMTNTDPSKSRILDAIFDSAQRGAGMVKQILTFARGSDGERGIVQPKHLVNEMIGITRHTFPHSIQIQTDVAPNIWTLVGNPTQLHQILLNLCVNARDAMPEGGVLTLAADNVHLSGPAAGLSPDARPGPYVMLTVTDTGTGMTPEIRARIFEAFFTTKAPDKGTGLGLSTVQSIVQDHGGFLTVDSELGQGTAFKVYLPAQKTSVAPVVEAAPPALPMGHGELILVVDDEAAIRSITTQTLNAYGYRVVTANDGAQAVAVCAQNLGDLQLMITDMAMPIMDGRATIHAIRILAPQLKIVAASGSDSVSDSPFMKELEVQAFLRKPYSADDLIRTVHEVLQRAG